MSAMPYAPTSPSADPDEAPLCRARHRVSVRLGSGIHLLVLLVVNAGSAATVLSHGQFRFVWLLLGWGLSPAAHGLNLAWSQGNGYQRMVDQELARLREQAGRR